MKDIIPVYIEDTRIEILARIAKVVSKKYGCTMRIDFLDGQRRVEFVGDNTIKSDIAEELRNIFKNKSVESTNS